MEQAEEKLYCPHCGSSQLVANKKGFGAGKAVTGAILTGGIGLLAGFIGSGDVKVTCLKCGKQWNPGELLTSPLTKEEQRKNEEDQKEREGCVDAGCAVVAIGLFIVVIAIICS